MDGLKVTDAELAVLQSLWQDGASTIREITDKLYPDGAAAQYATVQKLLDRLEAKGCIARERISPAHRFRAAVERDHILGAELEQVAARLCAGSLTPVLTHLAGRVRLSAGEREMLRKLLDGEGRKGAAQ